MTFYPLSLFSNYENPTIPKRTTIVTAGIQNGKFGGFTNQLLFIGLLDSCMLIGYINRRGKFANVNKKVFVFLNQTMFWVLTKTTK